MKKKLKLSLMILLVLGLVIGNFSIGYAAEKMTGREIMKKVYNREDGDQRTSNLKMVLINQFGDKRIRKIKQFEKDFGNVEKKIMFFIAPQDIRGTSFMNWSYGGDQDDNQWIYLPALRKIKRISSEKKSDYFMGTDFTYDDLGDRKLIEDTHTLLRIEEMNGKEYYVVESIPKEKDYIYSKTISWVSKDEWIGFKKEFYDPEGKLLKVLRVKETKIIDGILTITYSEMHNVQKDHKTQLKLSEVAYDQSINDQQFTERMMRRGL